MGLLLWSLQLDLIFLFKIPALPLFGKFRFVLLKYLIYLRNRCFGLPPEGRRVRVFGRDFHYNDPFGLASLQRVYCSSYTLRELLPSGAVIVDVGANVGQFNFFCRQYLAASKVVSVEPIKACYELLKLNAHPDDLCLNALVGDGRSEVIFHVCASSSQLSSSVKDPGESYRESYPMASRRMDELLAGCGLDSIDLFKIDTEGSEFEVLESAPQTMARAGHLLVELSIFRESCGNIFTTGELIQRRGFHLVELKPICGSRPKDTDALFARTQGEG